jgi:hypothetical protein
MHEDRVVQDAEVVRVAGSLARREQRAADRKDDGTGDEADELRACECGKRCRDEQSCAQVEKLCAVTKGGEGAALEREREFFM